MKTHLSINIDGALARRNLKGLLTNDQGDMSDADVRAALLRAKGAGWRVFVGDSCDNKRPDGGCAGHPENEEERLELVEAYKKEIADYAETLSAKIQREYFMNDDPNAGTSLPKYYWMPEHERFRAAHEAFTNDPGLMFLQAKLIKILALMPMPPIMISATSIAAQQETGQ
jgi:hypothetical protein